MNIKRIGQLCLLAAIGLLGLAAMQPASALTGAVCVDGDAGGYACNNIDMLAHLDLEAIGADPENGLFASDLWGWTSPDTGREFIMVGLRNATSVIDVTEPTSPVWMGTIPGQLEALSDYRDIKVFDNYAFILADILPGNLMQVFDLSLLDAADAADYPITFPVAAVYDQGDLQFGHNLFINTDTGYGYISRSPSCGGNGQHVVDLNDPLNPTFVGCMDSGTDDSDAECVVYDGPDADYAGSEICVIGSDEWVTISDMTDKDNMSVISIPAYPTVRRAHQVIFTQDKGHLLISDVMDEAMLGHNTRTHVMDVSDLDNPEYVGFYEGPSTARDHNLYILGDLVIQSNWRSGLRVINMTSDVTNFDAWEEIAYFDTYPADDAPAAKSGAWGHYDYLESGAIAVSDVESGLFMLQVRLEPTDVSFTSLTGDSQSTTLLLLAGALLCAGAGALLIRRERVL